MLLFEPYSYNPWRRISEFRDRFKGTIEKSFSMRSISKLCKGAGLKIVEIKRDTYVSTTKLTRLNAIHRAARIAYYKASEAMPNIFGMILLTATKGTAQIEKSKADFDLEELLRCPASKSRLRRVPGGYLAIDDPQRRFYPIKNGIPLLLTSDCELLSAEAFENLLSEEL